MRGSGKAKLNEVELVLLERNVMGKKCGFLNILVPASPA